MKFKNINLAPKIISNKFTADFQGRYLEILEFLKTSKISEDGKKVAKGLFLNIKAIYTVKKVATGLFPKIKATGSVKKGRNGLVSENKATSSAKKVAH